MSASFRYRCNPRLRKRCSDAHRTKIADEIVRWETLAENIGLTRGDVAEIKWGHGRRRSSQECKFALLTKWNEKEGEEATYLKLIEGLLKMENKDLADEIVDMVGHECSVFSWCLNSPMFVIFITVALMSIILYAVWPWLSAFTHRSESVLIPGNGLNTSAVLEVKTSKQQYIPPNHDLPTIFGPFVGREEDVDCIAKLLLEKGSDSIHIINICGPPAFGKSTLAINVGQKLKRTGVYIRYIDLEHKQYYVTPHSSVFNADNSSALRETDGSVGNQKNKLTKFNYSEIFEDELLNWTRTLQNLTVLTLDNCDGVLNSHLRDTFIELVNDLPKFSTRTELKLMVTSQERLVLLDRFKSWPVNELDVHASEKLLKTLVKEISPKQAKQIADSVGGCPLALKVIGQLGSISGKEFIEYLIRKLQRSPISTLNKPSDKRARFKEIMDTAYDYLDADLQYSAQYLSFFPGSFDSKAANAVLVPYAEEELEGLVRRSLVDLTVVAGVHRYKIHKLIRDYFKELVNASVYKQMLGQRYRSHYSQFLMNFSKQRNMNSTTEEEEFWFAAEKHNIHHLIESFKSLPWQEYSSEDLSTLALAIREEWLPLDREVHVLEGFMERQVSARELKSSVCGMFASYEECAVFYLGILDRVYDVQCRHTIRLACSPNFETKCTVKLQYNNLFKEMRACLTPFFDCSFAERISSNFLELLKNQPKTMLPASESVRQFHYDIVAVTSICNDMSSVQCSCLTNVIIVLFFSLASSVFYICTYGLARGDTDLFVGYVVIQIVKIFCVFLLLLAIWSNSYPWATILFLCIDHTEQALGMGNWRHRYRPNNTFGAFEQPFQFPVDGVYYY